MGKARRASEMSYSPYSGFPVGAAILCDDGKIYTGTNVENRSYGLTICAERAAICTAVSSGSLKIKAVAVFCPEADYPVSPCGACRQVISEFALPECRIIFSNANGDMVTTTIEDLFPYDALKELGED